MAARRRDRRELLSTIEIEVTMSPDQREAVLSETETRDEQRVDRPRMWRVRLHNADYPTQDCGV